MELGTEIKTENQHSNSENDVEVTRRAPTTDDEKEKTFKQIRSIEHDVSYNEIDMNVAGNCHSFSLMR